MNGTGEAGLPRGTPTILATIGRHFDGIGQ